MDVPYIALAAITVISTIPSLFYSAVELRNPDAGARLIARYTTARSLALFLVALVPFFGHFEGWLLAIATAMVIVQVVDTVIGIPRRSIMMIAGPAVIAVLNLVALIVFVNAS
jgi:hypothetical protein